MSRLMSVNLTEAAVRERRKTVTRRLGWWENKRGHRILKVGDKLTLCPKVQGRRRGDIVEPLDRIVEVTVIDIRRERLDAITREDVAREGWNVEPLGPGPAAVNLFTEFFCEHMGCTPDTIVTRIEWAYPTPTTADLGRMMDLVEARPDRHHPHVWQVSQTVWNDLLAAHTNGRGWLRPSDSSVPAQLYGIPVHFDPDVPGGIQIVNLYQLPTPESLAAQHAAEVAAALPYPEETP